MKVIIAGATGLVGGALVRQCISDPRISHAFVLARKPLPEGVALDKKVTVIKHEDFASYPPDLLGQLAGAEGCLWAIGGRAPDFPDFETFKKVQVDYTVAAASAFTQELVPQLPEGKKFRFVFCSGKFAEWDQNKSLLFMQDTRRIKGLVEKSLCDLADGHPDKLQVWCVRPSGILPNDAGIATKLTGKLFAAIDVNKVAIVMVKIALDGHDQRIIENDTMLQF